MLQCARLVLHVVTVLIGEENLWGILDTLLVGLPLGCNDIVDSAFVLTASVWRPNRVAHLDGFAVLVLSLCSRHGREKEVEIQVEGLATDL